MKRDLAVAFLTTLAEKGAEALVEAVVAQVDRRAKEREAQAERWRGLMDQARAGTWPPESR